MTHTTPSALATAVLLGLFSATAQAAPLTSWLTLGDVAQAPFLASATPGSGNIVDFGGQATLLGTASRVFEDDAPLAAGALNLSGNDAVDSFALTSALNLAGTALDDDAAGLYAMEGSAMFYTYAVQAGDTLSFDWRLLGQPSTGGAPVPDAAWLVLGDATGPSSSAIMLGQTGGLSTLSAGWLDSGTQHLTHTFSQAGNVTIGFAIADVNSFETTSVLAIQNVTLSTAPVPEPEGLALLLAGLGVLVTTRMRGQKTTV
jgi:hypothetical protein